MRGVLKSINRVTATASRWLSGAGQSKRRTGRQGRWCFRQIEPLEKRLLLAGNVDFVAYYQTGSSWWDPTDGAAYRQSMEDMLGQFESTLATSGAWDASIEVFFKEDGTSAYASTFSNTYASTHNGSTYWAVGAWLEIVKGAADANGTTVDLTNGDGAETEIDWNFTRSKPDANPGLLRHELMHSLGMWSRLDSEMPTMDQAGVITKNNVGGNTSAMVYDSRIVDLNTNPVLGAYVSDMTYVVNDYAVDNDWGDANRSGLAFHGIADDFSDMYMPLSSWNSEGVRNGTGTGSFDGGVDPSHLIASYGNVHPTWDTVEEVDRAFLRGMGYDLKFDWLFDYGDVPDPTYPTLLANDGARHVIGSGLFLGAGVDDETDGQPNATATGDDVDGINDDDGVVFNGNLVQGQTASIAVTASAAGYLDAWIDLDQSGSWNADEKFLDAYAVVGGPNILSLDVAADAPLGDTFARFRFSSYVGGLPPTGEAIDGEVEDYKITIIEPTNRPPVMASIGDRSVNEEEVLSFTVTAGDPNDDPANGLTLSATGLPSGAAFNPATGEFSWTPTETQQGSYDVTFTVTDDGTPVLDDLEIIIISVNEVNLRPVLGSIGNQSIDEQTELTFTATATDPDVPANTLAFSLDTGAPAGASIDPLTGLFTWTPTEAQGPGSYPITVRVTDDGTPVLDDFEIITISVNEVNLPPVLDSIANKSIDEQTELTFTATATDPDLPANTLAFSLDAGAPAGASIDPVSGAFSWTPTEAQGPANYPITVRVTDDGTPVLDDFEIITVSILADAAGITVNPTSGLTTTEAGGTATFTVVLDSKPAANVTIGLSSSDTTEGTVSPTSLTFQPGDWNTPKTVTVTGVNDQLVDGDIVYTIVTATATSADLKYNGIEADDVQVMNSEFPIEIPLGPIDFLQLNDLVIPAGGLRYGFEVTYYGSLALEAAFVGPADSIELALLDAHGNLLGTSFLVDGKHHISGWWFSPGQSYSVAITGVNEDVDLTISNLIEWSRTPDNTVTVHGTDGDDVFKFEANYRAGYRHITMNGVRYPFPNDEVMTVTFDGGEGRDIVEIHDSPGDDALEAWPDRAEFTNRSGNATADFTVHLSGFEELQAYAREGGTDGVWLHGSANNDKFKSYENFVRLRASNSIYSLRAKFFEGILGDGGSGGDDIAVFNGGDDNDIFRYTGADNISQIESPGRFHGAMDFGTVIVRAGGGTANVAHFTDTPLDDVFYFKSHKTKLVSDIVNLTARAFDEVHATASEGGFNVARIYDTQFDDHFEFDGDAARLYSRNGSELHLLYEAIAFDRVKAYRSAGNDTKDDANHAFGDELYLYGW